jgi:hypothetical protein
MSFCFSYNGQIENGRKLLVKDGVITKTQSVNFSDAVISAILKDKYFCFNDSDDRERVGVISKDKINLITWLER